MQNENIKTKTLLKKLYKINKRTEVLKCSNTNGALTKRKRRELLSSLEVYELGCYASAVKQIVAFSQNVLQPLNSPVVRPALAAVKTLQNRESNPGVLS